MVNDTEQWRAWFAEAKRAHCPPDVDMRMRVVDYQFGYELVLGDDVLSTRTKHDGITQDGMRADVIEVVESLHV